MTTIQTKRFDETDEVLELGDKGRSEIVIISDVLVPRYARLRGRFNRMG